MLEVHAIKVPEKMNPMIYEALLNHIDPLKQQRIRKLKLEEDRIRGLFANLLVRQMIMQRTGIRNREISFGENSFGKPFLKGNHSVHFNLSHSGMFCVAALDNRPIGIDIEKISEIDLDISRYYFSEDEHHDLMSQSDKVSHFFKLWTLKESYLKILGIGLNEPLNSFSIQFDSNNEAFLNDAKGRKIEGIHFSIYPIHNDYKMVICACHNHFPHSIQMHHPDQLIRKFVA